MKQVFEENIEEIVILIRETDISSMYSVWTKLGLSSCGVKMRHGLLSHYRNVTKEIAVESAVLNSQYFRFPFRLSLL